VAYDTLTAYCSPEVFRPDSQVGWKPVTTQTTYDDETDLYEHQHKWVWNDGGYDFTWFEQSRRLQLQVSLPRVLTGSNLDPWEPGDDGDAVGAGLRIGQEVHRRLGGQNLPWWADWPPYRVDATVNYHLADHSQVMATLQMLQRVRLPHLRKQGYSGDRGSVTWAGRTRRYQVYSKEIEQRDLGNDQEAARAMGILRAEARVQKNQGIKRVLGPLIDGEITVRKLLDINNVERVSTAILSRLEATVSQAIGGLVMKNSPAFEDIVKDIGIAEAVKALGIRMLYQERGEDYVRQIWGDKGNFSRTMKKLRDRGLDPRTVDLGFGKQLRLLDLPG